MRIAVCIKAVPDPNKSSEVQFDPVTRNVIRDKMETVINPCDLHAIELAMQLKDQCGAEVAIVTMGPPSAQKQLRDALSYGTDEAFLISDRAFGGADTLATAYTLAKGIERAGAFDLIITGHESSDGGTTHVPSQLGEWLGLPHVAEVVGCEYTGGENITVRKKMDDDFVDFDVRLPALIAVTKSINQVRYPNIKGIMTAKKKPLTTLSCADMDDLDDSFVGQNGSPTRNGEQREVSFARECVEYSGTPEEIAKAILAAVRPIVSGL